MTKKIDLAPFEWDVEVRPMRPEDFDAVIALQKKCFPGMKAWTRENLASHVERFPEGQIAVLCDGKVVASSSSLIVDFDEYEEGHTWLEVAGDSGLSNHDKEGDTLYEFTPRYLDLFSDLAVKYNVNIIGGSHLTVENDHLYNIAYLFHRNGGIDKQYKLHITPNERRWWGVVPGNRVEVFETDAGPISIQICYDIEFPEVTRIAVERGARIIFVPFCTDERHGYLRVRYCAQARCIENPVYVAVAGTVGNLPFAENVDIQYAQSGIFTPSDFPFARDGVAAECTPNTETVVIHDVDLELLDRYRKTGTVLTWQHRRKDLYEVVARDGETKPSAEAT